MVRRGPVKKKPSSNCQKKPSTAKPLKRPAAYASKGKMGQCHLKGTAAEDVSEAENLDAGSGGSTEIIQPPPQLELRSEADIQEKTSRTESSSSLTRKLNVLCLHGFSMNGETMREKCQPWETHCADIADFHYPSAPNVADAKDVLVAKELDLPLHSNMRRWASTWKPSKDFIEAYVNKEIACDVDVVLGFSQGACITMKIINEKWTCPHLQNIKAAVFVASPPFAASPLKKELPTLHIIGSADDISEKDESLEVAAKFHEPTILEHPGHGFTSYLKALLQA